MDALAVFCVFAVVFTDVIEGSGVLPDGPLTAAVGGTVSLNTKLTPTATPLLVVAWTFIVNSEEKPIITSTTVNKTEPPYEGRITLFIQTGSLELRNLALNDSGDYRVSIITDGGDQITGTTTLKTLVPVSDVKLMVSSTDLVEFNSTARLSCSSSGSSLSFLWLNGSSEVTVSDRVQLTDGGATLSIVGVTRYDHASFACRVSNAVSEGTSDPEHLTVSFGPDDIHLKVSPLQQYIAEGSNVVLSCTAASRPLALFSWALDGELLSYIGPDLSLVNIQESQSGKYSCHAFNGRTLRHKTSQPLSINVLKNISGGSIVASTSQPIEGMAVNLTCDAAGSIFTREWMKSGSALVLDDHMALHDEGRVLSFRDVRRSDSGPYSCRISNPINMEDVSYGMAINYGPEAVQISGPREINVKQTLTLTCSATSVPSATYTWTRRNQSEIHNTSTFVKNNVDISDSGSYVCIASNNITGVNVSAEHRLAVTEKNSSLCSAGCIAGIVIASLVICAAAAGAGYYIYNKQKQSTNRTSRNISTRTERERQDITAESKNEELNYADLNFFHTKDGQTVQSVPQNNSAVYAEIRVNSKPTAASSPPSYNVHMQRIKRRAPQPFDTNEVQV
ncbi:carcinoembryonic antigen-related cell adhesion molecule 5-like [Dunckerocampus dactyliophorus]|uniref:carcinoembryonic antigen-related cell adhesion molecule 5-like n=1 Tax=Dunckerocampus dactyliophorus TaxID=161453 RepID=UPI0024072A5A|nr:carcinoembryonic antigen-related cell adhesion molecule 5-like [Dunckerocampus dactyliophorus]